MIALFPWRSDFTPRCLALQSSSSFSLLYVSHKGYGSGVLVILLVLSFSTF